MCSVVRYETCKRDPAGEVWFAPRLFWVWPALWLAMLRPGIVVAGTLVAALAYVLCAGRVLFGALVLFPFVSRLGSLFLAPKLAGAWRMALPFGPITVVARSPSRMTWGPVCAIT